MYIDELGVWLQLVYKYLYLHEMYVCFLRGNYFIR